MKRATHLNEAEMDFARATWGEMGHAKEEQLRKLIDGYRLSVALGDVTLLENRWYVTHSGLLRLACRRRCAGIKTSIQRRLSAPGAKRWVFRAVVYKIGASAGFVGYGDADPTNVSPLVHGAEMRIAETRAVNRALRKAYGIGLCSVEELGWVPWVTDSRLPARSMSSAVANKGHGNGQQNGQPRLRDRLCLLIRQHMLDASLVKAYAADYCGTATLRDANRGQIEEFINHLAERAAKDREGLLCQLNGYAKSQEVTP